MKKKELLLFNVIRGTDQSENCKITKNILRVWSFNVFVFNFHVGRSNLLTVT